MNFIKWRWWSQRNEDLYRVLLVLFLGQVVSFAMALAHFTSSLIANLGANTPLTLSFFSYSALALVYGSILVYRRQKLLVPWYWYLLLGFVDVQGNYLVNKAYQYTTITSVTILDCWTIAWVVILTWIFLGTRYTPWQFCGAAVCILGLGMVLLSDARVGGGGGSRPFFGDLLVIGGTVCYALSNVGEEFCVKKKDRVEVISMLGLFAMLVSVGQIAVTELKSLEAVKWTSEMILAFFGYAVASFTFYSVVPFVMKMSGATLFNLSLLTSDMWAVVIRIFFYKQQVDWLYYLAFALVGVGLTIYSKSDNSPMGAVEDEDPVSHLGLLEDEATDFRDNEAARPL
ncbi:OLC1v1034253C1 [Oldenlandia corymbosa var. corymbosa]|uniref:OLC1v1034253C1 n=1 Tax=Oldenlandia corymbosa var. corymbosa TaxID=529605 RepID=A0AAV1CTB5_OLDCO|nr:OLC1v1034253C1 [Oldenlandia corymbosa var. corymbosa]